MSSVDLSSNTLTQHVATLLDDLITWRNIGSKQNDPREVTNIQAHGGAWMPADRSFDRILFWRTVENNTFQLFEYSLSRNLSQNALQIQFGVATNVLPNVFVVELPDRQQICLMFVTHIGVYRWIISHPTINSVGQLDQSQSILGAINDDFLSNRSYFYRHDLQLYNQVTCAYTNDHLIYALYNEIETIILRFDNQNYLNTPQQFIFPKRQSAGLFNFLWNPNKSISSPPPNQSLISGQTTIIYNTMTITIILYDTGLLRFLSDQLDTVLYEHNLSTDVKHSSKTSKKIFLDYCQYETFDDELITRVFIVLDSNDLLHLLIYEFQYDKNQTFQFSLYQNKTYTKSVQTTDHSHLPHGSSLTSLTCTNDRLILHFLTNQNRSMIYLIQYELKNTANREEFLSLPMNLNEKYFNQHSTTIEEIERRLNLPGEFTIDMIKDAFWITFNCNLDEFNQSWTSVTQILQQLPMILQTLCNEHCEENAIRNEDCLQILTKFWQNLYSTLIDLRAQSLVLLACRIFDERQLIILIHKAAISLYSIKKDTLPINVKYSRCIKDIESLLKAYDDETLNEFDGTTADAQKMMKIERHIEPVVSNNQLLDTLRSLYEKSVPKINTTENQAVNQIFQSKIARRLLVLVFVEQCYEKINQIERLNRFFPITFHSNHIKINSTNLNNLQDKILPYLQDLLQIYQVLLWISSCGVEISSMNIDDRELFIETLVQQQQYKSRIANQSLLEQILADYIQQEQILLDSENWFEAINASVNNLFSVLWPNNDFLLTYLLGRHQWTVLDQYCGRLNWFNELNSSRLFFHALTMYRSGTNTDTATRHLAIVLKDLHKDSLLVKLFGKHTTPELFYIEWIREFLKYFGQSQHIAAFFHQSLQSSYSNEIRALIIKELFQTSLELKNFDDAFWCIQNTNDYLSQKQYTFEYAMSICLLPNDQSLYRLQTLIQYQRDKLGCIDLELLAHLERTCVENQSIQSSHVFALYEIYKMMKLPLKMAQIMYHYACQIEDVKEQKNALQFALQALLSIEKSYDSTDSLFIYPINAEYNSLAPLANDDSSVRLIGIDECRQKLAVISAIYILKTNRLSSTMQITEKMHPTQLSGLLTKFHHDQEAQQLLDAFHINKSSMYFVH